MIDSKHVIYALILSLAMITSASAEKADTASGIDLLCKNIKLNQSKNSAEYVPGQDVYGKPVTGADINTQGSSFLNDPIVIPIELDLVQRAGLTLPLGIELEPTIANLSIHQNGKVSYNSHDITQDVKEACAHKDEIIIKQLNQSIEHGHESNNAVPSKHKINDKIHGQYP